MNNERIVELAVMCLQELDAHAGQALSFKEISRRQGIPMRECAKILKKLAHAGIVELAEAGRVVLRRSVEELTALDILEAVWARDEQAPAFMAIHGAPSASLATLKFVQRCQAYGPVAING